MLSAAVSTSSTPPPLRRTDALRMAIAAEQELRRRRRAWKPTFRGASLQVQETTAPEWMSLGPAESAKTWGICWKLVSFALATPRGRGVLARRVRNDMTASVLRTFERVYAIRGVKVTKFGGELVQWYEFENGFRYYVVGLDRPGKVLSGEFDVIYVNQAEEISLEAWETLSTRVTGRGAVTKTPMLCGDCNPGPPSHWILKREGLERFYARHEDNPTLYDDDGNLTEQGEKTMATLDRLTGVRLKRLRFGQWVASEGVVYDGFDRAVHVIPRAALPKITRWVGSIDWGFTNPSVFQLWGVDGDGRMYLVREIYRTQRIAQDFAQDIKALLKGEGIGLEHGQGNGTVIETIVADHDAEDRATLARHGVGTRAAIKEIQAGIQKVQARFRIAGDGKARLYLLEDALVEADADLLARHLPTRTVEELEVYAFPSAADGKPVKELPVDLNNHGCDATRYATEWVDRSQAPQAPFAERVKARVEELGIPAEDITERHMAFLRERESERRRTSPPRILPTTLGRLRRPR